MIALASLNFNINGTEASCAPSGARATCRDCGERMSHYATNSIGCKVPSKGAFTSTTTQYAIIEYR
jgi:hypothetical protein